MPPEPVRTPAELLQEGLRQLELMLDDQAVARLLAFLRLLDQWGKVYNLTALRSPEQAVVHHLLDALAIWPVVRPHLRLATDLVADVGSGAGVPGLVLAMVEPRLRLLSIEPVGKKAAFQRQVCAELGLAKVEVRATRVEAVSQSCSLVLTRAFAALQVVLDAAAGLLGPHSLFAAMKGQQAEIQRELAELDPRYHAELVPLVVPGLAAERHLVLVSARSV